MLKYIKNLNILILLLGITLNPVWADGCLDSLKQLISQIDNTFDNFSVSKHQDIRSFVASFAKRNDIPVFLKKNQKGLDVPVILVNKNNVNKMRSFFKNSYGTQVALQPNYTNDHGLMRFEQIIVDLDSPGNRGFGELHKTGLAWKDVQSYVSRRTQSSSVIVELTYLVTPEEKSTIELYQRVRRSAFFRVKFELRNSPNTPHPDLLQKGGEDCFIFCRAGGASEQIKEIKLRLAELGVSNPQELLSRAEVNEALNLLSAKIMNSSPDHLSINLGNDSQVIALMSSSFPSELGTVEKKAELIRWLMSYKVSNDYKKVLDDLGVTLTYEHEDFQSKRVSAMLIYDESANIEKFKAADYSVKGAETPWPNTAQAPY